MKVLVVNYSESKGGAARAAERLVVSLRDFGVDCQMIVVTKQSESKNVIEVRDEFRIKYIISRLLVFLYPNRSKTLFSPIVISNKWLRKEIERLKPDIIHLHWVAGGMSSLKEFEGLDIPIVWSLHDTWAFTGGCHYTDGCTRYKQNCGMCKVLGSTNEKDLSRWVWKRKTRSIAQVKKLHIVGLSKWLNNCSKESTLFVNKPHYQLPNPINTDVFKVYPKFEARKLWSLPQNKRIVLFGAMNATGDPRKGYHQLCSALEKIESSNTELVVYGNKANVNDMTNHKIHGVGQITEDSRLATLYSAADVMTVPSLQENLSNAIMESLSSGTPVVAFDIGGNSDMIEHKVNGYLAKPYDVNDFANGIEWILNHPSPEILRENARAKVVNEFDYKIVAPKYISLYEDILRNMI